MIQTKRVYSLLEIVRLELLLSKRKGNKPVTSIDTVKKILKAHGFEPEFDPVQNQMCWKIKGEDIRRINKS